MALIFNWQKTADILGAVSDWYCYDCCQHTKWEMGKVTQWVGLFNVRTLPLKRAYQLVCSNCSDNLHVSSTEFRKVKKILKFSRCIKGTRVHQQLTQRIVLKQLSPRTYSK
ncbi:MAG: hypothetical protein ACI8WB_006109 [Phenylobacterium sp.]|jgi:hypothetical protein